MKRILSCVQIFCLALLALVSHSAQAQDRALPTWTKLPGTAVDLSINAEGQAYAAAQDGTPWRWDKVEGRWRRMSGNFKRISAAEGNRPWAVDGEGIVYRYNGLWWENKDTDVADVAADATGNVYIAKTDGSIKVWYPLRSEWRPVDGAAWRIALDGAGNPWVVTAEGVIQSYDGKSWSTYPGRALDIAVGGTDTVAIADREGGVRTYSAAAGRWDVVPGVNGVLSVAVTPDGGTWAVLRDGSIMATSLLVADSTKSEEGHAPDAVAPRITAPGAVAPASVAPVETAPHAEAAPVVAPPPAARAAPSSGSSAGIDPATITAKGDITFANTRKNATSIAIGKDGSVFALDAGGNVLRWSNTRKAFDSFPGSLVRIAVDPNGNPWGVSALGRVFRHTGTAWKQIVGATASDIAIGSDGTVVIADVSGTLFKLNAAQTSFDRILGNGMLVAVGPDGTPWTVRSDKLVQRCDTMPCTVFAQRAESLSIGPDGSVWIVSDRNLLMRLNADGKTFDVVRIAGNTPAKVAVGPNGYPWVVNDQGLALASTFFKRDEGGDRKLAAATSGDTIGSGASETPVTSNASGFTFTKSMQFETLSTSNLSPDFQAYMDAGNDGNFYVYSHGEGVFIYDESKKKFILESTTVGTGTTYKALDFGVASNGDIWFYTNSPDPKDALYRERSKTIKQYTAGSGTTANVAVAPDDTVYAHVTEGGSNYLYKKTSSSEVFTKFSTYDQVHQFDVGPGNDVWIIDKSNYVKQWNGTKFEKRPTSGQKANKIKVGADGTVYIVDQNSAVRKWNGTNKSFDKINNITTNGLAVDDDGRPWLNTDGLRTIKRAKD